MSQHAEAPGTADVLSELAFLATVEHALIVEYLTVCCVFGHDLSGPDGGPSTQPGIDVATAAEALADAQMLRVKQVVRLLDGASAGAFGRARSIPGADGAPLSLDPPTPDRVEHLLDREETLAAAVDARYARLRPAVTGASDEVREAVEQGTTHAAAVAALREGAGTEPAADLLRATRRIPGSDAERVMLRASDRGYALVVGALRSYFADLDGDRSGTFRIMALDAMNVLDDANRTLVHAGLLPQFTPPPG